MTETEVERLVVRLTGDARSYLGMLKEAGRATLQAVGQIDQTSTAINRLTSTVQGYGQTIRNIMLGLGAAAGVAGLFGTIQNAIGRSGEMEQTLIAFEVLVGSAEKAKSTLADLNRFAAETPFELPEILEASKMMLAFGSSADELVPTMQRLGDISAGLKIPIGQLSYLFGTLKSQGRAFTVDINQFAMRGIPIWKELEKITGKNNAQVRKMVEQGQVGFPLVEQAFKNMAGEGGRFFGLMEKQSKSLLGLWSTFKDNVGQTLVTVGDAIVENLNLKDGLKSFIEFTDQVKRAVPFIIDRFKEVGRWVREMGVEGFGRTVVFVKNFVRENQKLVVTTASLVAAVVAAYTAYRVMALTLSIVMGLMTLLKIKQAIGLVLWLAWTAAVFAAKLVVMTYTVTVWALNAGLAALSAITSITSVAEGVMTGATWLLNIALAVLEAETVVPLVIALVALAFTITVIVAALATVTAGAYGAYKSADALLDVLLSFSTSTGPIAHTGSLFGEWWEMLKAVNELARTDLDGAWKLLQKGAEVAVSQIMDLWPPLWNYIREGWKLIAELLYKIFMPAIVFIGTLWEEISTDAERAWENNFFVKIRKKWIQLMEMFKDTQEAIDPESAATKRAESLVDKYTKMVAQSVEETKQGFDKLNAQFSVNESERTKRLKGEFDALKNELKFKEWKKNFLGGIFGEGGDTPVSQSLDQVTESAGKAQSALSKFDLAQFGSAEALQRIQEYKERIAKADQTSAAAHGGGSSGGGGGMVATSGAVGGSSGRASKVEELLSAILLELQKQNNGGLNLQPANVANQGSWEEGTAWSWGT